MRSLEHKLSKVVSSRRTQTQAIAGFQGWQTQMVWGFYPDVSVHLDMLQMPPSPIWD